MCIILVFGKYHPLKISKVKIFSPLGALLEYAAILLLLKKKRVPLRKLDKGSNGAGHKIENILGAGESLTNGGDYDKSFDMEVKYFFTRCTHLFSYGKVGDDSTFSSRLENDSKCKQHQQQQQPQRSRKRRKSRPGGYSPIYQAKQAKINIYQALKHHDFDHDHAIGDQKSLASCCNNYFCGR